MATSRGHRPAGGGTRTASDDAVLHVAEPFAIPGALGADPRAFPAGEFIVERGDKHEVCGDPAHLRAGHQQPEVRWRDMLAASLQAVVHRHAEARLVTVEADVDALLHFGR